MGDNEVGIYTLMSEVRSAMSSLDYIKKELSHPEYASMYSAEIADVKSQRRELSRVLAALSEIESSVYSYETVQLQKKFPGLDPSTPDGHRLIRTSVAKHTHSSATAETGDDEGDTEEDDEGDIEEDDEGDALIGSTSRLVDDIKSSISPDLTTMIGRISKIETDIQKLQTLVTELKQKAAAAKGAPGKIGFFDRLQDTINLASQVAGTVTIRGVRHTIETYSADEPVNKMFTSRFQNLGDNNLVLTIKHLHKDAAERVKSSVIYGSTTLKEYKAARTSDVSDASDAGKSDSVLKNVSLPDSYRFISLIPTAPLSLGLPADKAFSSILHDVAEQVTKKTYTFNTHDPTTYEESDTGSDIVFDLSGAKRKSPSYLEEAILRLSLEYLDVIHKYLISTQNTTRGYVAILPCSVFGMKLSTKLLHYKTPGRFSKATGDENKKSMKDLVEAYNMIGDERKQLPHIAYVHTDNIKYPIYNLEHDSESIYSSKLPKTISMLGQLYVRFARKSSRQPLVKIGLQDTIAGSAVLYDFPNFKISYVYSAFNEADDTVIESEATRKTTS